MPRLPLFAALVLLVAPPLTSRAAQPAAPSSELIQASDLLQLKQLESPAISPDGRWVVYVVRSIESKPEAKDDWVYTTHLWQAAIDGSTPPRQLTRAGNDATPVWHPSGERIAFVRTIEKEKPQIYTLSLAGGEAQPITKVETGAGSPRWSPDGTKLLFSSALSLAEVRAALEKASADTKPQWKSERPGRTINDTANWGLKPGEKDKGADKAKKDAAPKPPNSPDGTLQERREWLARNEVDGNPRELDRLNFLDERDINPELTFNHLFVQATQENATPIDITPGYHGYVGAEWMKDGQNIVCVGAADPASHPDRTEFSALYLVDAAGGGVKPFASLNDYSLGNPHPAPDGKTVALTAAPGEFFGYGQAAVATVPVAGGDPTLLTEKLDRTATDLRWSGDSRYIYFVVAAGGGFPLYRFDTTKSATERVTMQEDHGVRSYDVSGQCLAQVLTTPTNPAELVATLASGPVRSLTAHNSSWLSGKRLSAYESHQLMVKDGLPIQFWTMKPTRFDAAQRYPLLLEIHGGPSAMWGPGEDSMWFEFQYFAARGYAIVFCNPRGSGGYGFNFQHANHKDWGIGPASDILTAVDFAAKEKHINKQREVITGGSYGGYMTAWIVSHDHRFKAAVAQHGVYDLITFFGEGNAWRLVPRAFGGYPWQTETRHLLERDSPFTYVESITTPLLLQHGDNDRRTGFVQSEMMLRSLKVLGREVEEVRYPRATHEMSRSGEPKQRLDSLVRYEEFFRRYIGEN